MKREIKFRAWNIEKKQMYSSGCVDLLIHFNGQLQGLNESGYVQGTYNMPKMEIMQFTGLLDKNGKEIFENDVVKANVDRGSYFNAELVCQVEYLDGAFQFLNIHDSTEGYFWMDVLSCKIIGDIYTTPELLGAAHER